MDYLFALFALMIIGLTGSAWVNLLVPKAAPAKIALVSGNGILLGLILIPLLMRLLSAMGVALTFHAITLSALVCMIAAVLIRRRLGPSPGDPGPAPARSASLSGISRCLLIFFLGLLALRLGTLGLEMLSRPLLPFDATMHWATKSRAWFEHARIIPFVENQVWLESGGVGVYTDHHPGYPVTIPLLQVWMNSAVGYWDESLMNLPWLLCYLGLGLAFFGQARSAGADALVALMFTYLLLSLPLLNVHVALAGYADLFLGASYCAALMAFYNWSADGARGQAILAVVFASSCVLIKNEGLYWLATFLPWLLVVLMPRHKAPLFLAALLLGLLGILVLFPRDLAIAGHSLASLKFFFRPEVPMGIFNSLWVHDNWHLFAYLLVVLPLLGWFLGRPSLKNLAGITATLVSAVTLFLILYMFTRHSGGAIRFSSVGRISLHLVPGIMFLLLLVYNEILSRGRDKPPLESQAKEIEPDAHRQEHG